MRDEERVYVAELTFADGNGAALSPDTTQRAQFAVVLGQGNGMSVGVRAPNGASWAKYEGTHVTLPVDEYDTFGGYIFGVLGSVPDDGSKFELDSDGLHIRVLRVSGHRVEGSIVTKQPEEKEE